jgi:hypothetical protein
VESVAVREWLWRRPYTLLEVQARPGGGFLAPLHTGGEGVHLLEVSGAREAAGALWAEGIHVEGDVFTDHHGFRVKLV